MNPFSTYLVAVLNIYFCHAVTALPVYCLRFCDNWHYNPYIFLYVYTCVYNVDPEKALFMEVSEEQRQLAQQARAYGEQRQALTDGGGRKKQVVLLIASGMEFVLYAACSLSPRTSISACFFC